MYSIRLLKPVAKQLQKLDRPIAKRILDRLEWLSVHLDSMQLHALKGDLSGLYKLREAPYRIIFELLRSENTIIVHAIGHRREIYTRR